MTGIIEDSHAHPDGEPRVRPRQPSGDGRFGLAYLLLNSTTSAQKSRPSVSFRPVDSR